MQDAKVKIVMVSQRSRDFLPRRRIARPYFTGSRSRFLAQLISMRRWALAAVFLYLFALLVLTMPVILIAFAGSNGVHFQQAIKVFLDWGYWLWLVMLVSCQALLLLLPLKITERRFIPRRTLV